MELQEIRKLLPCGAITEIAQSVGVSRSTVSLFFNGRLNPVKSTEILEEASKIIELEKIRKDQVINKLNGLCNSRNS